MEKSPIADDAQPSGDNYEPESTLPLSDEEMEDAEAMLEAFCAAWGSAPADGSVPVPHVTLDTLAAPRSDGPMTTATGRRIVRRAPKK